MIKLFLVAYFGTGISPHAGEVNSLDEACQIQKTFKEAEVWQVVLGGNEAGSKKVECKWVEATKAHWEAEEKPVITRFQFTPVITPNYQNMITTEAHVNGL